jgi:hypothetical protein
MPDFYTWDHINNDLAYFVEELNALKPLIGVVPVYDNPGSELSIEEILLTIDLYQKAILNGMDIQEDSIVSEIKSNRVSRGEVDIQLTISNLESNRAQLIDFAIRNTDKLGQFAQLIIFERFQLRKIAEHILTITSQD